MDDPTVNWELCEELQVKVECRCHRALGMTAMLQTGISHNVFPLFFV